jgi:hypothetical protein
MIKLYEVWLQPKLICNVFWAGGSIIVNSLPYWLSSQHQDHLWHVSDLVEVSGHPRDLAGSCLSIMMTNNLVLLNNFKRIGWACTWACSSSSWSSLFNLSFAIDKLGQFIHFCASIAEFLCKKTCHAWVGTTVNNKYTYLKSEGVYYFT